MMMYGMCASSLLLYYSIIHDTNKCNSTKNNPQTPPSYQSRLVHTICGHRESTWLCKLRHAMENLRKIWNSWKNHWDNQENGHRHQYSKDKYWTLYQELNKVITLLQSNSYLLSKPPLKNAHKMVYLVNQNSRSQILSFQKWRPP